MKYDSEKERKNVMKKMLLTTTLMVIVFAGSTSFAENLLPHKLFVEHNSSWTSTTLFYYQYKCHGPDSNCQVYSQYGLDCNNIDGVSMYGKTSKSHPLSWNMAYYWDSDDSAWHNTFDTVSEFNSGATRYYKWKEVRGLNNDDFDDDYYANGIRVAYIAHNDQYLSTIYVDGY